MCGVILGWVFWLVGRFGLGVVGLFVVYFFLSKRFFQPPLEMQIQNQKSVNKYRWSEY